MDLYAILKELKKEKAAVDEAIVAMEKVAREMASGRTTGKERTGRSKAAKKPGGSAKRPPEE